jgi:hypothetical protein
MSQPWNAFLVGKIVLFGSAMIAQNAALASPSIGASGDDPAGQAGRPTLAPPMVQELMKLGPEFGKSFVAGIKLAEDAKITAGNPASAPLKWAGLWETVTPDNANPFLNCTGQFISPRVILLAAHCVRNQATGEYYDTANKNSIFLLQFQNHDSSHEYSALCKVTWSGWVLHYKPGEDPNKPETWSEETSIAKNKAWQWDYAFVYLDGESITGHYNYDDNGTHWVSATSTGYPGKIMEGSVIQKVWGDVFNTDVLNKNQWGNVSNVLVLWHGNANHTQGASGGAWVANFNQKESPGTNVIIGLNSFDINPSKPGASFGPKFTDKFTKLLDFASGGCKAK